MSNQHIYQCRGLRKWCDRRCEATSAVEPPTYPVQGFYCALHGYQKPRQAPDGVVIEAPYEPHLRRRTSFVAPEHGVAAEMMKSPAMIRDRPGAPRSAAGQAISAWLQERRGLDAAGAAAYANRMVQLDILAPLAPPGLKTFSDDKAALYRIQPKLAGGAR